MHRRLPFTLYPMSTLPNWRWILLSLIGGPALAWLYNEGLLWLIPATLVALVNAIVLGVLGIVVSMFVFGKAD
jgi:hypothetical protein